MGRRRKDRLRFRRRDKVIVVAVGILCACLPVGIFDGDTGRILTIFLGLVSASILPTVSMMVGTMSGTGRSVAGIDQLNAELRDTIDILVAILGFVLVAVLGLLLGTINLPDMQVPLLNTRYSIGLDQAFLRLTNLMVGLAIALALSKFGRVPSSFRRALEIRHQIAVEEAKRRIEENAPSNASVSSMFATSPGFGQSKKVVGVEAKRE